VLSEYPWVILDCEGQDLGDIDGELSLVCLGTPVIDASLRVFIIDILAIRSSPPAINDLRQFLSGGIIKVVWDGRMDSIEIFAALHVRLDKVLDLQVAEVISRKTVRGETDRQRTERLAQGRFGFRVVRENRETFRDLHLVVGMQRCLEEQKLDIGVEKDGTCPSSHKLIRYVELTLTSHFFSHFLVKVIEMHKNGLSSKWMDRPLPANLLQYAANDIVILAHLFVLFRNKRYIPADNSHFNIMVAQSRQYVSRCGRYDRIDPADMFRPKGILMMSALGKREGPILECAGCGSKLLLRCFESKGKGQDSLRKTHCRSCVAMALRNRIELENVWVHAA